jgi:hypothetical protein
MHRRGYLVWGNDDQYWHRTFRVAQRRVVLAQAQGKHTSAPSLSPVRSGRAGTAVPARRVTNERSTKTASTSDKERDFVPAFSLTPLLFP